MDKPVDELIPYVNNARTHSDEQVAQIAASIQEFGFNNPILVDGDNGLIAGHGRLSAAKKIGLEQVPCVVLTNLNEAQKKQFILADNQIALNSGWDFEMLQLELDALGEMGADIDLLGFDANFLDGLMDEEDYTPKTRGGEIDLDDMEDTLELKFKLSIEQYDAVKEKLMALNESPEIALLMALEI